MVKRAKGKGGCGESDKVTKLVPFLGGVRGGSKRSLRTCVPELKENVECKM